VEATLAMYETVKVLEAVGAEALAKGVAVLTT
jgi:hypothetical protein